MQRIMKIARRIAVPILLLFFVLWNRIPAMADYDKWLIVYVGATSNQSERNLYINKVDTIEAEGGYWQAQYWNGSSWVGFTGEKRFNAGTTTNYPTIKLTDIPGAAPTMKNEYTQKYVSGTTYQCTVGANSNSAVLKTRYLVKWDSDSSYELFNDADNGYLNSDIEDQVVGYYYKIDHNASANSLNNLSGATYQTNQAIPYDVSQLGWYVHVKAKSFSGATSAEKVIRLIPPEEERVDLRISCGTGIAKVTATGAASGTSISSTSSAGTTGKFYPGETVTITESTVSNGEFSSWSSSRGLRYKKGNASSSTASFVMSNLTTRLTANGKLWYNVTIQAGSGISKVALNGQTGTSLTKKYYEGDTFSAGATVMEYYSDPVWKNSAGAAVKEKSTTYSASVTGNMTYTVTATQDIYKLRYNGLSGATPSSIPESQTTGGKMLSITSTIPTKTVNGVHYEFAGWKCTEGDSMIFGETFQSGNITMKQNVTLTAQWKAKTYTVKLYGNKPAESSSSLEHISNLQTNSGVELKNATPEQIEASGYGNFGYVTSYKDGNQYRLATDTNVYSGSNIITWVYCNTGAKTSNIREFETSGNAELKSVLNIVYDNTTKKYYTVGTNTDVWSEAAYNTNTGGGVPYMYFGATCGTLVKDYADAFTYKMYSYSAGFVCLRDNVVIPSDNSGYKELKDVTLTSTQMKDAGIKGFAVMSGVKYDSYGLFTLLRGGAYYLDSYLNTTTNVTTSTLQWRCIPNTVTGAPISYFSKVGALNQNISNTKVTGGTFYYQTKEEYQKYVGTIVYDTTSKGYYQFKGQYYTFNGDTGYTGGGTPAISPNQSNEWWIYLGPSYKVLIPSEWDWTTTNSATGDGYYTKTFNDVSSVKLPQLTESKENSSLKLTGWKAGEWVTKDGTSSYAPGTDLTSVPVTSGNDVIELYANWKPIQYTIEYIGNGGYLPNGKNTYPIEYTYDRQYYYDECQFSRAAQANGTTRYQFKAWYQNGSASGQSVNAKSTFKNLVSEDGKMIHLYAGWTTSITTYKLHYDPNGATVIRNIPDKSGISYLDEFNLENGSVYYKKQGYVFAGWIKGNAIDWDTYQKNQDKYQCYDYDKSVSKLSSVNNDTVTMYALWKPNPVEIEEYTIHYEGNGADFGTMENQVVICGTTDAHLKKNQFGKDNYTFTGWKTEEGVSKADQDVIDFATSDGKTITLYAQWTPAVYCVNYDGNGANRGEINSSTFMYDTDEKLSAFVYEKTGYHVDQSKAWINTESGKTFANEQVVNNLCARSTNMEIQKYTLKANWITNKYTIAFHGNGATSGSTNAQVKTYGTDVLLNKNGFKRTGYVFIGWSLSKDGKVPSFSDGAQISNDLTDSDGATITLYAVWRSIGYTITYDRGKTNDTQGKANPETTDCSYDKDVTLASYGSMKGRSYTVSFNSNGGNSVAAIAGNLTFKDWIINNKAYASGAIVKNANFSTERNGTVKAEAEWNAKTISTLPSTGKAGYTFAGWYSDAALTKPVTSVTISADTTAYSITLYAKWQPNTYTVNLYANQPDTASSKVENHSISGMTWNDSAKCYTATFTYDSTILPALSTYTLTGWDNKGWNTAPNGTGSTYAVGTKNLTATNNGIINLYAKWQPNTYIVNLHPNVPQIAIGSYVRNVLSGYAWINDYYSAVFTYDSTTLPGTSCFTLEGWTNNTQWYSTENGTGKTYEEGSRNLTSVAGETVNLYVKWSDITPPNITDGDGVTISNDEIIYDWRNTSLQLEFAASDIGSGIKSIVLRDASNSIIAQGLEKIQRIIREEGISKYRLTATDNAGNIKNIAITVRIDKQPPTADNQDSYIFDGSGQMTLTFNAFDTGGSGVKTFELYAGTSTSEEASLLKSATDISGDTGRLEYQFADDNISDSQHYFLKITDHAGNITIKDFDIKAAISMEVKAYKKNGTTVTDDSEVLTYKSYGDMRLWIDLKLNGYVKEVQYDFCDELNQMGVDDVTHTLTPEYDSLDSIMVYLSEFMTFDKVYPVTITAIRNGRTITQTINISYVELVKPKVHILYQNGMAMPKGGGDWKRD